MKITLSAEIVPSAIGPGSVLIAKVPYYLIRENRVQFHEREIAFLVDWELEEIKKQMEVDLP
jgi:hypothetical protein